MKDLETQVDELQKASQATNHENTKLRSQVDRMTNELKQYKQKISLLTNPKALPKEKVPFGASAVGNLNDVNFQFNFPKFGNLPGPQMKPQRSTSQPISPQQQQQQQAPSPQKSQSSTKSPNSWQQTSDAQFKEDLAKFSGVFTPSMASSITNGSRASLDSANFSVGGATSSPSASSHSNAGPSSSCGTSPEPFTQSPMGSKPIETMTTIGEEHPSLPAEPFAQFANIDFNSNSNFDWLAQQNTTGSFDPQLFGDYRESQDNVLANPSFDDFFNDSLDTDFFTPYNMAPPANFGPYSKPQEPEHKPNLMEKIEAQKNDYDEGLQMKKDSMNCNQIWYASRAKPDRSCILTSLGNDYKNVPRLRTASSISTVSAPNSPRRPSALVMALSSVKPTSTAFSRSTWARTHPRTVSRPSLASRSTAMSSLTVSACRRLFNSLVHYEFYLHSHLWRMGNVLLRLQHWLGSDGATKEDTHKTSQRRLGVVKGPIGRCHSPLASTRRVKLKVWDASLEFLFSFTVIMKT